MPSGTGLYRGLRIAALAIAVAVALAGCASGTGPTGPPGPAGAAGPVTVTGSSLTALILTITGATLGATSSINFSLAEQNGVGYVGLPASTLEVTVAKLIPGGNGDDNAWQSYINVTANPTAGLGIGTQPTAEATDDSSASLVNHKDGTYTYTLGTNITTVTTPIAVPFDPTLTRRVAIDIRESSLPAVNGVPQVNHGIYTFQPSSGATSGILTQDSHSDEWQGK